MRFASWSEAFSPLADIPCCKQRAVKMQYKLRDERNGVIDLLLTDLVMPGKNGRMLAKELNATFPEIKVVYMSGYVNLSIAT